MTRASPSLREELEDACAKVRRQIEVQEISWPPQAVKNEGRNNALLDELRAELDQLEAAIAELDEP